MEPIENLPPPYSSRALSDEAQPAQRVPDLEPWQRRWNREWFKHAFVDSVRRIYAHHPLPIFDRYARIRRKEDRAMIAAHVHEAIDLGIADEEDYISLSWWTRTTDFWFRHIKQEFREFREWRRDRKNREKVLKVIMVMEDVGDNPKWKGEMIFKIPREHWAEFFNEGTWFDFPSPKNIKWFWTVQPVTGAHDYQYLPGPSPQHWGPDRIRGIRYVTMPFCRTAEGIVQHGQSNGYGFGFWNNFREDLGHGFRTGGVIH
ncbi:hypothetical protein F5B19DRAFT_80107 [Rostrohypoxylon terebratum]|nr:hypothetical protein F5B19DRAFT_80107 [Rostrohypoxylon terebratum]